jgi:hypothetical protein
MEKIFEIKVRVIRMIYDVELENRSLTRCYTGEIRVLGVWHINM